MADADSWRLTDRDRRQSFTAMVAAMSSTLGALAPLAVWGFDYLYDRRDLIFTGVGVPARAYTSDGVKLALSALTGQEQAGLAIDTTLTASARASGLREGDPVSLVVSGHNYVRARSGMVVPSRIGERVNITVPSGGYSVTAIGSRKDSLFSTPDPYDALAGKTLQVSGRGQVALSLTARAKPVFVPIRASGPRVLPRKGAIQVSNRLLPLRGCLWCGAMIAGNPLAHGISCPSRPRPMAAAAPVTQPVRYRCDRCGCACASRESLAGHMEDFHPVVTWWRALWDEP